MTKRVEQRTGPPVQEVVVREEEERVSPCFVRHPDAGGRCPEPGTVEVYGLHFCEAHGEEARLGAVLEATEEARHFVECFRVMHLANVPFPEYSPETSEDDHFRALRRAYSELRCPEKVRRQIVEWEECEVRGCAPVMDRLLDSLYVLFKLMRLAEWEGETWLVEMLEIEREGVAAQAAYAMRDREHGGEAINARPG